MVPTTAKLIITDFMYYPQADVRAGYTIDVVESTSAGDFMLLQLRVNSTSETQAHFHTGFVIAPGSKVTVLSSAAGQSGSRVSLTMNGYLAPNTITATEPGPVLFDVTHPD